jgi:flagellar hook-associated protein 3 FlgL
MRISDRLRYEIFEKSLIDLKSELQRTQEMISSGKSILRPKDDPVNFSISIQFDSEIEKYEQYVRNTERLIMLGGYYDSSINKIHELLGRAKEIAITQASDTMNSDTRRASNEEIKGIIEQLVSIGNTEVQGLYIFGGKKLDTKPFDLNDDYSVTFNGTEDVISVYTDSGVKEDLGISGYRIFLKGTDIFSVLKGLKEALEENDVEGIRDSLDGLNQALSMTETNLSYVGTYVAKLERTKEILELRKSEIQKIESEFRDVDLAKIVSDFNALTLTYQTMLYAMARIQELNILNYLK